MPLVELRVSDIVCLVPNEARVLSYNFSESGDIALSKLMISWLVVATSGVEMNCALAITPMRIIENNDFEKKRINDLLDLLKK
jgi:hypothetical protein